MRRTRTKLCQCHLSKHLKEVTVKKPVVLVVGQDGSLLQNLRDPLRRRGFQILEWHDKSNVLGCFQSQNPDVVLVGSLQNGDRDALEVCQQIRRWDRTVPLIMIAANSTEDVAIAALRAGFNDYFKQPFSFEELVLAINQSLSGIPTAGSPASSRPTVSNVIGGQEMIGESSSMADIKAYLSQVASIPSNVLITGETGTGKDLAAGLIHRYSPRSQKPLVCINCAAIPDSLLESELFGYEKGAFTGASSLNEGKLTLADGGTVFFDEIGDMSPYAQAKILRVIESKELQRLGGRESISLNIRVIAATNQDLEACMAEGKFRKDLYFRLNVARLHLPPLRDRKEDISSLLDYYIRDMNCQFQREVEGLTDEALEVLFAYDYPGNIRELKNLLEAAFAKISSRRISVADLPSYFRNRLKNTETLAHAEHDRLLFALSSTNWNRSAAARKLEWSRMTLYRKMAKYHLITSSEKLERDRPEKILQAKGSAK